MFYAQSTSAVISGWSNFVTPRAVSKRLGLKLQKPKAIKRKRSPVYTIFVLFFCLLRLDDPNLAVSPPTHKHHRFRVDASTFNIHTAPVHTQKQWLWTLLSLHTVSSHATARHTCHFSTPEWATSYVTLQHLPNSATVWYLYSTLFNNHSFKVHWRTNLVQPSKLAIQFRFILF